MTDERALFVPLDTGADAGAGTGTGAEAGRGTGNGAEAGRGGGAGGEAGRGGGVGGEAGAEADSHSDSDANSGVVADAGGSTWLPTDFSRGPWDPDACHGGPPAALVTRALEAAPSPVHSPSPMRLVRVSLDLVRPVPLRPLRVSASVQRPGRRVELVEATLRTVDDDVVVTMARALRIRTSEPGAVDLADVGPGGPGAHDVDDLPPPLPEASTEVRDLITGGRAFHNSATEHRFVRGDFHVPGPVFDWIRLVVPVVPGEVRSPWQRAVAAADFGNGIGASVPFDPSTLFINPDLTVHLWREPVGEWIGMESTMRTSTTGIGLSDSAMWDASGRIGRGNQSLFLDRLR